MKIASWEDYKIIKASNGLKLEKWKNIKLLRPDPIIIWNDEKISKDECDAFYHRSNTGGGYWENINSVPSQWKVSYKNLTFNRLIWRYSIIFFFVGYFEKKLLYVVKKKLIYQTKQISEDINIFLFEKVISEYKNIKLNKVGDIFNKIQSVFSLC